ncbi:hypothetical protein ACFO4E_29060 [Nocardiopsis mangrovi]|uniref:WXG100 family type VII secretion target n=1 Tax=Nocardiopsis mangrovi TaxID=1179818 RepID=A0ABV9E5H2_9ACTN
MPGDSMYVRPDSMRDNALKMDEAADLVRKILADHDDRVAALRDAAWGHGDEIADIGKEKFDPGNEQISEGGTALEGALRKLTDSTINSAGIFRDNEMENTDISYDLANNLPGNGPRR